MRGDSPRSIREVRVAVRRENTSISLACTTFSDQQTHRKKSNRTTKHVTLESVENIFVKFQRSSASSRKISTFLLKILTFLLKTLTFFTCLFKFLMFFEVSHSPYILGDLVIIRKILTFFDVFAKKRTQIVPQKAQRDAWDT